MLALVQRVSRAQVSIGGAVVGAIERGLLVFVCAEPNDTEAQAGKLVDKLLKLRIFSDHAGKMNLSVQDVRGGVLLVSQFTLAADTASGNRPGFSRAARPEHGRAIYERVVATAAARHPRVASGVFGAAMRVHLVNDGPVTIPLVLRG